MEPPHPSRLRRDTFSRKGRRGAALPFSPCGRRWPLRSKGRMRGNLYPLPSNGIFVALIVMNSTFVSNGSVAMVTIALPT